MAMFFHIDEDGTEREEVIIDGKGRFVQYCANADAGYWECDLWDELGWHRKWLTEEEINYLLDRGLYWDGRG